MCLVGDNCNVNKSLAPAMSVSLITCTSYKFNQAVQKRIKMKQPSLADIIAKVGAVIKMAASMKVAAKLVQLLSGHPLSMVDRSFLIQPQLHALVELLVHLWRQTHGSEDFEHTRAKVFLQQQVAVICLNLDIFLWLLRLSTTVTVRKRQNSIEEVNGVSTQRSTHKFY